LDLFVYLASDFLQTDLTNAEPGTQTFALRDILVDLRESEKEAQPPKSANSVRVLLVNMFINDLQTAEGTHYPEKGNRALLDWYFKKALPCAMRKSDWRRKNGKYLMSELISVGDEAMVLTMLENSWNQWHAMFWQGMDATDGNLPNTKFTGKGAYSGRGATMGNLSSRRNTGKGLRSEWNMEGVLAYNTNYAWVRERREKDWSKVYEEAVRADFHRQKGGVSCLTYSSCDSGLGQNETMKVIPIDELNEEPVDEL
jgi:hypothetical protein